MNDFSQDDGVGEGLTSNSSRRRFLQYSSATVAALSIAGTPAIALAQGRSAPAFRMEYPENVRVSLTDGRTFDVVVTDLDGEELERFDKISLARLFRVRSDYFVVHSIVAPVAA